MYGNQTAIELEIAGLKTRIKELEAIKAAAEEVIFQVYLDAPGTFHHDETAWDAMECLKAAIKALNTQEEG